MDRTTMRMGHACARTGLALPLVFAAMLAGAQDQDQEQAAGEGEQGLDLAVTAGASWSDNIGRVPQEEAGTLGVAGLILGYQQRTARLETDLEANVVYEHYFDDTFDDDVVGGIDGTLIADIVSEHFRWYAQENFGQIVSDPFAADRPDNRQDINYFTTGPDFTFRLGSAMSVALSGRYSSTAYETSQLDSERYGGTLALIRQLSGTSTLSANGTAERIEFDNSVLNTEYDRYQAFLRYDVRGSRTDLALDLGYTSLETDSDESDGPLARLSLSRRISASSRLTFGAGTQFSSTADLFRDLQDQQGVQLSGESVIASSDPFEYRFASLGWDFERNRTGLGLAVQYGKEEYENLTANDRTLASWSAYVTRQLSRAAQLRVFGAFDDEQFDNVTAEDQELRLGAAVAWNIGRTLELRLQYDYFDRDSTAAATEYTENRTSLFMTWSAIGTR